MQCSPITNSRSLESILSFYVNTTIVIDKRICSLPVRDTDTMLSFSDRANFWTISTGTQWGQKSDAQPFRKFLKTNTDGRRWLGKREAERQRGREVERQRVGEFRVIALLEREKHERDRWKREKARGREEGKGKGRESGRGSGNGNNAGCFILLILLCCCGPGLWD